MLSREESERQMAEFNSRLGDLFKNDPNIQPNSLEVKALIKEFNDRGLPIKIVSQDDVKKATQNLMQMLSEMGMHSDDDNIHSSQDVEKLDQNLDPCKYHKKGIDTTDRTMPISKKEVDDVMIDMETLSDKDIWERYFGVK